MNCPGFRYEHIYEQPLNQPFILDLPPDPTSHRPEKSLRTVAVEATNTYIIISGHQIIRAAENHCGVLLVPFATVVPRSTERIGIDMQRPHCRFVLIA
eukprot:scaffold3524_cov23-Prasinocladus_malaysianus.AAC.1